MSKQPEALRLADALETEALHFSTADKAAAELRRLHAMNCELVGALKEFVQWLEIGDHECDMHSKAVEVITKAEAA